jgi:uroporphyrinogen-III synthase|nr:MAG: uroporphyrinogen III methyltransferase [Bacteroidota bacterium]
MNALLWLTHLRARDPRDAFRLELERMGWQVEAAPLLAVCPRPVSAVLRSLRSWPDPAAILFTSPRSVAHLGWALSLDPVQEARLLRGPSVYVVGPATARYAQAFGWRPRRIGGGGAEGMLQAVLDDGISGPVLFPCSAERLDVLPEGLRQRGIPVLELALYAPEPLDPEAFWNLRRRWRLRRPDGVVWFSPSAVAVALTRLFDLPWEQVRHIAIGPTTARALQAAGLEPAAVSPHPDPAGLRAALKGLELELSARSL